MAQEILMNPNLTKILTEEVVTYMKNRIPGKILTMNCMTFHCFVFYGLMDPSMSRRIDEDDYEPWRERSNWKRWGVSELEWLRYETFAHFEMHRNNCFRHPHYRVLFDPIMGLGLYPRQQHMRYRQLYPGPAHTGLFGYIEFLNDEEFDYFHLNGHPSMYQDPEGNKGIMYGMLYFCNHQSWAPSFQPLNKNHASHQVLITTRELMTVNVVKHEDVLVNLYEINCTTAQVQPNDPNLTQIFSQDIDQATQETFERENGRTVVTKRMKTYWIVILDVEDMDAIIPGSQIYANYGEDFNDK